jgi:hypothetical protein
VNKQDILGFTDDDIEF